MEAKTCYCPAISLKDHLETQKKLLPASVVEFIEKTARQPHPKSHLISVLHKVQEHSGYINHQQIDAVAQLMQIPTAEVSGVATFYHFFRLKPRGRFTINICMGTACYVKGADKIVRKVEEQLGITFGETTKDGLFTLEQTRCLGTCGLAPVVMINDDVHPRVTPEQMSLLIEQYMNKG